MKYQAFISYKHSDFSREKVLAVENALKKYAKSWWKPWSIKIFRDEKEMAAGTKLGHTINKALEDSEYLLYFASREAAQSEWVQKELHKWCVELNRSDRLIIILISDKIMTDSQDEKIVWEQTDALPYFLKDYITDIPIFEELSWSSRDDLLNLENTRFREQINRITARFRGKTPAEINDENVLIDRRNKRIKNLGIGLLLLISIILMITTWFAINEKNLADKQTREALNQKNIANLNAQEALKQKDIATQNEQKALKEKKRADEQAAVAKKNEQNALEEKNRADGQYKEALCNRLASEAEFVLQKDFIRAIRIAEAAYKIGQPSPSAPVVRALCSAAYSNNERPHYSVSLHHSGRVNSAVFSPDGSRILTASRDETAKLWDLNGKLLADLKGHTDAVNSAVFSTDGSRILTSSDDNTAKLWDLNGKLLADLKGHTGKVNSAVFSSDGSRILTASNDFTAKLWDFKGNLLADFKGHTDSINSAVFSSDGSRILTASRDKTAKLWDVKGKLLTDIKGHTDWVNSAVFSSDGSRILTASPDKTVKLWDLKGKLLTDFKGHTNTVNSAVFSPDGSRILTASNDGTAKVCDLNGKLLADIKEHTRGVYSAVFSPDGSRILTASYDHTAKLWDLDGNLLADLKGYKEEDFIANFSPDGKHFGTVSDNNTAIIWPTPETIMEWLKTSLIPKLTDQDKKELGIEKLLK